MTVRMKALKTFRPVDSPVGVHPGDEYDAKDGIAAQHERAGMAIRVGKPPVRKEPKVRSARPLSQAGGRAGKAAQSSSSRPARARKTRKASSRKPRGGRAGAEGGAS